MGFFGNCSQMRKLKHIQVKEFKKMACDLLMKNKTAVLKKGVNHAKSSKMSLLMFKSCLVGAGHLWTFQSLWVWSRSVV